MIRPSVTDNRPLIAGVVLLIGLAWVSLAAWNASPYSRYLDHRQLSEIDIGPGGAYFGLLMLFVAGWVVMTAAMMLPTSLPLVLLFQRIVAGRRNQPLLVSLLLFGYFLAWAGFGAAAHAGDLFVHAAVAQSPWLEENSWIVAGGTLIGAGAYQFSPLKYLCLEKCRSPFAFIIEHWRGGNEPLQALRLGVRHGLFCVGCCWTLMLLMFVVGMGNLGWMFVLGTVMAIEKNISWGGRLMVPVGLLLIVAGLIVVGVNLEGSVACAHDGHPC